MSESDILSIYTMFKQGIHVQDTFAKFQWIPIHFSLDQYYTLLFKNTVFMQMFWNSTFLVVPIVIGQVVVASMSAFVFSKIKFRGRDTLFMMYVVTMMMPFVVTLVPNYLMVDLLGLMNTRLGIILPGIFTAFGVFLLRQFMITIPDEIIEAAKVDGASTFKIFFSIILPMSKSGVASLVILAFIDHWNMVEQPVIFLENQAMHPLSVFLGKINTADIGVAFAAGVFYMLPTLLLFIYGEKHLIDGISHTSMK
jgi:multiple sugar transport system permease protein